MAHCVVSARSPFRIISVSPDFATLVGFGELELLGRSFAILRGPETDTPVFHAAIKAVDTNPQKDVHITLYGRAGDRLQCSASFTAVLDFDGHAIGCEISVRRIQDLLSTMPQDSPIRTGGATSGPCLGRRRHNLYVGLLLESEAKLAAKANAQMAAARLEEEALLCQLLAAVM